MHARRDVHLRAVGIPDAHLVGTPCNRISRSRTAAIIGTDDRENGEDSFDGTAR